jgi:hypothetical protein
VSTDLSVVPGQTAPRHLLAYFDCFDAGWYGITNTALGLGVGLVWPKEIFPYAWFWQELCASSGHPWYRGIYVGRPSPLGNPFAMRHETERDQVIRDPED